jgi:hypothetical protein
MLLAEIHNMFPVVHEIELNVHANLSGFVLLSSGRIHPHSEPMKDICDLHLLCCTTTIVWD